MKFVCRLSLAALAASAVLATGWAQEATPEATAEVPALRQTATLEPLTSGVSVEGRFTPEMTMQMYLFFGSEGDRVTITMEGQTIDLDSFLIVLGPNGEVLAADDDSGPQRLDAQVSNLVLPADNLYMVLATTFSSVHGDGFIGDPDNARYKLTVSGNTDPASLMGQTVNLSGRPLVPGEPTRTRISVEEPVFYFFFDANEGDVITLEMESPDFDTLLYLFNAQGERIAVNDDADSINLSKIEALELSQDGPYVAFATVYGFPDLVDPEAWGAGEGRFAILLTKQ